MRQYFCLGSYTEPILFGTGEVFQGKGKGVSICSFEDGMIQIQTELAVRNPSFLCIDEDNKKLYAVNEMKEYLGKPGGGMTQIAYDCRGNMKEEGTWNTVGTDPCHIIQAPDRTFLSVANFASGSVSVFPLDAEGNVTSGCDPDCGGEGGFFQHSGNSVHPVRQRGPHAHSTIFAPDHNRMYVPDLGIDWLKAYTFQGGKAEPDPGHDVKVPLGSGPRFGEFDRTGRHFYLINEIGSQVMHFRYENGNMIPEEQVSTLPEDYQGDNICSDLHITPDGRYLYASNRGHDSLACCRIGAEGRLEFVERQSCGGKTPRNFAITPDGAYLLCGNQDSDYITVFSIGDNGHLTEVSRFETGSPVCIQFFKKTEF